MVDRCTATATALAEVEGGDGGAVRGRKQLTLSRWAALMVAGGNGRNDIVQLLAGLGADVTKPDKNGVTGA